MLAEPGDRADDVVGCERDVLDAGTPVELEILVDLALLAPFGRLVDGELDPAIPVRHDLRHQGAVFGGDVLVVEADDLAEAQHVPVEADPVIHPAQLDVADTMVDVLEPGGRRLVGAAHRLEAGEEDAAVVPALDQGVNGLSVGADRGGDRFPVAVPQHGRLPQRSDDLVKRPSVRRSDGPPVRRSRFRRSAPGILPNFLAGVLPGFPPVGAQEPVERPLLDASGVLHQTGEDPLQLFGSLVVLPDQGGGVGVVGNVLPEERLAIPARALQHVPDQPTQEGDVGTRPDRRVVVGHGTGPGEAGVHMDQLGAPELGLHGPAESDRVTLRHVGALDHDAIGQLQVPRVGGRGAASQPGPQTGDAGGVSYPGLVLDRDHS